MTQVHLENPDRRRASAFAMGAACKMRPRHIVERIEQETYASSKPVGQPVGIGSTKAA
jgi:hypothetical protein